MAKLRINECDKCWQDVVQQEPSCNDYSRNFGKLLPDRQSRYGPHLIQSKVPSQSNAERTVFLTNGEGSNWRAV